MAEVAARSRTAALDNPYAQLAWDRPADELLAEPTTSSPRCASTTARRSPTAPPPSSSRPATWPASTVERPAWIRGIDHRIEPHDLGLRDLTDVAVDPHRRPRRPAWPTAPVDVAELHAPFTHQELILREALGLGDDVDVNPSGGALAANPMMAAGLIRIGEVGQPHHRRRGRPGRRPRHERAVPATEPRRASWKETS